MINNEVNEKSRKPKSGTDINSESAFFIAAKHHDIAVISLYNSLIIFFSNLEI